MMILRYRYVKTGGEWKTLPSYLVKVDEVRDTKHCVEDASMAIFDFSGKVDVKSRI